MSASPSVFAFRVRADLWLALARAFSPPDGPGFAAAFARDLAADLAAIAAELGLEAAACLHRFARAAGALAEPLELERLYAALFLVPPAPVPANTAIYLDGALLGPSELAMARAYERLGYVRHPAFGDLCDHPTPQLEFVARLYGRAADALARGEERTASALAGEARHFLAMFPSRWITPFVKALERACAEPGRNTCYLWLARFLWLALEHELAHRASFEQIPEQAPSVGTSRGSGGPTAEDLAEIAARLEAAGLSFDHLRALPAWREDVYRAGAPARSPTTGAVR
ncbi:MAG: molecular chaperone TorD family protein [Geminicoccaceae bacterium]|nr:molecular chaperone TorD family protein [Geminicoccaceae bacterium]